MCAATCDTPEPSQSGLLSAPLPPHITFKQAVHCEALLKGRSARRGVIKQRLRISFVIADWDHFTIALRFGLAANDSTLSTRSRSYVFQRNLRLPTIKTQRVAHCLRVFTAAGSGACYGKFDLTFRDKKNEETTERDRGGQRLLWGDKCGRKSTMLGVDVTVYGIATVGVMSASDPVRPARRRGIFGRKANVSLAAIGDLNPGLQLDPAWINVGNDARGTRFVQRFALWIFTTVANTDSMQAGLFGTKSLSYRYEGHVCRLAHCMVSVASRDIALRTHNNQLEPRTKTMATGQAPWLLSKSARRNP